MAMITDPDLLAVGTEITLDTTARTFTLVAAGDLVAKDGVDANALWSFFVDIWATATYKPYPFPMNKIDNRPGVAENSRPAQPLATRPANDSAARQGDPGAIRLAASDAARVAPLNTTRPAATGGRRTLH